ncbi:MAG: hypothetical protein RL172_3080 [Bacteroidota bacterium]
MGKFCGLLLAGCWLTLQATAQQLTIKGTVQSNGMPIPAATVMVKGHSVSCDSAGRFILTGLAPGSIRLRVTSVGYQPATRQVELQATQKFIAITLQPDSSLNDEVVISGTMRPVSKMASPIPVEVFTPAYFKKNPSPNIFESLQMVNGLQPQLNCNVCNTGDIHINGMEGPYTMILIDGMPIVSSLSTVYGLAGIPNSMVKRIEVVKGPASALYGSEAVGGLINIITKDAILNERLKIDFSSTHIGEHNADITLAHSGKKIAGLLGINYFNFNNRLDVNQDGFTDLTLQNRLSVFNKWTIKQDKKINASLGIRFIAEDRWGGQLQWNKQWAGSDSIYGESITTKRAELVSTISNHTGFTTDISYNYHQQKSFYGKIIYNALQQVAFAQVRWTKKLGKHQLLAGIPLRYTYYDDNTAGTANTALKNQPQHSFLPGIFIQDEVKAANKLTVLGGMRYDYNSVHGSIITPRLSFKYSPVNNHTLRLSAGNGYRVVNLFTEDHAALTGAREVVIAQALKPEKSWNVNANYSAFLRHSHGFINADVSVFYTYFTNKIIGDYFTNPAQIIYDNLSGYAVSKGITFNADCNFTNGIKLNAGLTLMDVYQVQTVQEKIIKTPQLFAPGWSGTFALSYLLPKGRWNIDVTGRINGPMYLPVVPQDYRNEQSPAYALLNAQISKPLGNFELYAGVKNLLNFLPKNPLLHPDDPFNKAGGKYFDANGQARPDTNPNNYSFDTAYNYAPIQGAKVFAGIRYQLK